MYIILNKINSQTEQSNYFSFFANSLNRGIVIIKKFLNRSGHFEEAVNHNDATHIKVLRLRLLTSRIINFCKKFRLLRRCDGHGLRPTTMYSDFSDVMSEKHSLQQSEVVSEDDASAIFK